MIKAKQERTSFKEDHEFQQLWNSKEVVIFWKAQGLSFLSIKRQLKKNLCHFTHADKENVKYFIYSLLTLLVYFLCLKLLLANLWKPSKLFQRLYTVCVKVEHIYIVFSMSSKLKRPKKKKKKCVCAGQRVKLMGAMGKLCGMWLK